MSLQTQKNLLLYIIGYNTIFFRNRLDSLRQERDQGMYGGPRGGHQQGGPPPPQGGPPHPHGGGYESDQGRVKITSKWDVAVSTTGRNTIDIFLSKLFAWM